VSARIIAAYFLFVCCIVPQLFAREHKKVAYYLCPFSEYYRALDVVFSQGAEDQDNSVAIRIFPSFQPESEIVLRKTHRGVEVIRLRLEERLWGKVFRKTKPTNLDCQNLAENARLTTAEIPLATEVAEMLFQEAILLNLQGDDCIRTKSGHCVHILDGISYEVRVRRKKTRLSDTSGTELTSENEAVLQWVLNVRKEVESAEP
jgi:hypothetical protein